MTPDLLTKAARELETMIQHERNQEYAYKDHTPFPPACQRLLKTIPGNIFCADCGATNPQWATITYGALLCLNCSGRHRSLGVQLSVVRSIHMDSWSHKDVLAMLEGGNTQLNQFFDRHDLSMSSTTRNTHDKEIKVVDRYETNAAKFYRKNLSLHVTHVKESGIYKGRDWSRRRTKGKKERYSVRHKSEGRRKTLICERTIRNSTETRLSNALLA